MIPSAGRDPRDLIARLDADMRHARGPDEQAAVLAGLDPIADRPRAQLAAATGLPPLPPASDIAMPSKGMDLARLPVVALEVREKNGRKFLSPFGSSKILKNYSEGAILDVPPGEYDLSYLIQLRLRTQQISPNAIYWLRGNGAIIRSRGGIGIANVRGTSFTLLVTDLTIHSSSKGRNVIDLHHRGDVVLENVTLSGGANTVYAKAFNPDLSVHMNRCKVIRGGKRDSLYHNIYLGHVKRFEFINSWSVAPHGMGHGIKCYGKSILVDGSVVAQWWDQADFDAGYSGRQTPLDFGSYGTVDVRDSLLVRRLSEFEKDRSQRWITSARDRQYFEGRYRYAREGQIGTRIVDPRKQAIDNRDLDNPFLLHHVYKNVDVINGLGPNGEEQKRVFDNPGYFVKNEGTDPVVEGDTRTFNLNGFKSRQPYDGGPIERWQHRTVVRLSEVRYWGRKPLAWADPKSLGPVYVDGERVTP